MSQYRNPMKSSKDTKNIKLSDYPEEAIPLLTFDPVKKSKFFNYYIHIFIYKINNNLILNLFCNLKNSIHID